MHTAPADLRDGRHRRRRHSDEFKAQVVAECARPGVSIAAIALHHGLNANLLRRWVSQAGALSEDKVGDARQSPCSERGVVVDAFVPVAIAAAREAARPAVIEVKIKRGPMAVQIHWPLSAAAECSAWLRALLG